MDMTSNGFARGDEEVYHHTVPGGPVLKIGEFTLFPPEERDAAYALADRIVMGVLDWRHAIHEHHDTVLCCQRLESLVTLDGSVADSKLVTT